MARDKSFGEKRYEDLNLRNVIFILKINAAVNMLRPYGTEMGLFGGNSVKKFFLRKFFLTELPP